MPNPQTTFTHTTFTGPSLLSARRSTIAKTTVGTQLDLLRSTGRYDCFKLGWHKVYEDKSIWPVPPHLFWDSDLAKWIEGACYYLHEKYDADVDKAIGEIVADIRSAQAEDGYLNLHHMVVEPGKRWTNLEDMHELYNAGHLIEAALAHANYYHNDQLLGPVNKYVSLISRTFGPGEGQRHGYPGHPEIELALLRLYKATGSQEAYRLARFFLEERGNPTGQEGTHYYNWEREVLRGESAYKRPDSHPKRRDVSFWASQAHQPILEQPSVEGHAVRAMYLLTGAADLLCLEKEGREAALSSLGGQSGAWRTAVARLWDNMVDRKMYLTGGIGAMWQWEGFGLDYFLPQDSDEGGCYAETCAGIGVMMLAERLLELDLDGRYGDVMELCLYNNVMTAISLDGRAFTYVNQLGSSDRDRSVRHEWFECSCCPPNMTRLFGSLGGYLWHFGGGARPFVNVHLYTTARLAFEVDGAEVALEQESRWPWEGDVAFRLTGPAEALGKLTVRLRIPAWAKGAYALEPAPASPPAVDKGYLVLEPSYLAAHPSFTLRVRNLAPRYIAPHPRTNQRVLALARGPVVYCVEDVDNPWAAEAERPDHFKDVSVRAATPVEEEQRRWERDGLVEEYVALRTKGWQRPLKEWEAKAAGVEPGIAVEEEPDELGEERELVFVPYYFRANRGGKGVMRVGLSRP